MFGRLLVGGAVFVGRKFTTINLVVKPLVNVRVADGDGRRLGIY